MLSSIHPLGERAKNNSFPLTATAFAWGGVAGGAVTGALAGTAGAALDAVSGLPGSPTAAWAVAVVAVVAAVVEATGRRLPSPHRQVDERWLDTYRNWVYGLGYGVQLGAGVTTTITTAAVHVMVVAAVLVGDPAASVAIGALFGLVRGLSLVPARAIASTDDLVDFFQRLERRGPAVQRASTATLAAAGLVAALVLVSSP